MLQKCVFITLEVPLFSFLAAEAPVTATGAAEQHRRPLQGATQEHEESLTPYHPLPGNLAERDVWSG